MRTCAHALVAEPPTFPGAVSPPVSSARPRAEPTPAPAGRPPRQAATNAGYPIGRIATPGEVAEAVVWLAAGATFSTGTALVLDGGAGA